ncbi:hypothetical protein OESDEN_10567 [Oesophagostomum dentatum]|uniref:Uncharacterized protein n=1 Tax=Oesophagostomum dentatum TaxID=61180 RepID=A0A0B1SWE4_OESDE|nr:hypothetical protein OESDEN_10567 [Oesophagostomum dentatum]
MKAYRYSHGSCAYWSVSILLKDYCLKIIVDRVAYSPLAEAKAVISDHRHPLGVRLVNVRPSGLKRVPMSEMTEEQDAPPNPRLARGAKTNYLRRSPEAPRRSRADQNSVIDREAAGGRRRKYYGVRNRVASIQLGLTPPIYIRRTNEANGVRNTRPSLDFWAKQRLLR